MSKRYEIRQGKFGAYFHDTHYNGFDMPLSLVLEKLNRLEEYTARLKEESEARDDLRV